MSEKMRCKWATGGNELYVDYHDREWGVAQHDDRVLFEFLILEGAQAGLSWSTILNKRETPPRATQCWANPASARAFHPVRENADKRYRC